ncbi:MAG: amino acid ABC transporter substrate-binding protein [Gammaproteobacteria bacterium]|nr:amino acid ABC transporter substrate-binding protein [Gammaproteobacteria bacterium]MBU2155036.1 amino acid ABC transporter substrate-binding protein [Gammaproteobacteria bacterium]MBU2255697.1 amino acid ABC transporter substrate-binding protein [Gammaproteobacteria bacterium]MBU2295889.1 amino acid ABC transporter substrate-binding protein [Gammaproteobacteria bacterium]
MNGQLLKPINLLLACLLVLPLLASASTLERVRSSNSLTLGYLPDIAPFSSQQGGQPSGYAIELCEQVAAHIKSELGLADLQVRYQAVDEAESIAAVISGSIDILCSPTLETLRERRVVSFSLPIYTAGLAALVREDASPALINVLNGKVAHSGPTWRATINRGLANHTYAVTEGGATEAWVRQQQSQLGVVATLVTVANPEQGVQLVADGKADAFFSERILLQNYLAKNKDASEMRVLERIYEFAPVAMALARSDEDLRLLVDTALSESYRSGELGKIYRRHLGAPGEMVEVLFKVYALPR